MKDYNVKQNLNENKPTKEIEKSSNSLGFLIAALIIIFCVGSIAVDTILTKKSINRQLDIIESRLVSVDQKLDEIVLFLQSGQLGVTVKPILLAHDYNTETVDSLAVEVENVQDELNQLKDNH